MNTAMAISRPREALSPRATAENVFGKQELLDLAAVCEEVANNIEDRLTGG